MTSISEITGMEGDVITMQEIFVFEKAGISKEGKVVGRFRATGVRPKCCGATQGGGHPSAAGNVRRHHGGAVMLAAFLVFLVVTGLVAGGRLSAPCVCQGRMADRRMARRLREVSRSG